MSTPTLAPEADRAPSLASRVVGQDEPSPLTFPVDGNSPRAPHASRVGASTHAWEAFMDFTRAQVTAALTALGLDPDLTASVVIGPRTVYVEVAVLEDGHPAVENGALRLDTSSTTIDEQEVLA